MFGKRKQQQVGDPQRVNDIVGQILSDPRELAFATERAAHEYIAENSDDIDGIIAIACAAARTIPTKRDGVYDVYRSDRKNDERDDGRARVIESAFLSRTNPQGRDRLTRALLHETRTSEGAARVLADYFAEYPQKHDWAKSIRDHIVIDIPDANRIDAQNPSMHDQQPFRGVQRMFEALKANKRANPILQALGDYAPMFDPLAFRPQFPTLAKQLLQDYPNDLEHAAASLVMLASDPRGNTPEEILVAFARLLGWDEDAIVNRVIEIGDSFKIPLPSSLAEGIARHGSRPTGQMVKQAAAFWKSLSNDASPTSKKRTAAALEFMMRLASTPSGATAFFSFLAETPDFDHDARNNLLHSFATHLATQPHFSKSDTLPTFTAGVVDLYRRGLINGIDDGSVFLVGTVLFGSTGAAFRRYIRSSDHSDSVKHLLDYLATTDLGKDGDYDPIKTENTLRRILQGTGWIDAIISSLDNAASIEDGQQMVDDCLLPALIARPEHTQHMANQLKQRMDNAKSLHEQAICVCAFGHLCERLHEVHPSNDVWTMPSRKALERKLQLVRPALLGRARILRNALASSIQDIHQSRTLTDAEYQNIYETLNNLDTAIDSIAASAFDPDFDTPTEMRDIRRQHFAEPTGLLKNPSQLWEYQQLNNEQLKNRLCGQNTM
jgi:hypothetical protein